MLLAIEWQSQPSTSPAIAIPILVQVPAGLSKKNAAAIPPMTIPAPTLFQNEAANLTRSLRCSVELLSKCSSSRMSVLLKYAVPVCRLEQLLPNAHRRLEGHPPQPPQRIHDGCQRDIRLADQLGADRRAFLRRQISASFTGKVHVDSEPVRDALSAFRRRRSSSART